MSLSPDQLRDCGKAMFALAAGKPVEYLRDDGRWEGTDSVSTRWHHRPKVIAVTRQWSKPDDVPGPMCWLRFTGSYVQLLVIQIDDTGLSAGYSMVTSARMIILWDRVYQFEHSTDRKTWKPCTVEEAP